MKVHVLHENPAWLPVFERSFAAEGVPWEDWYLDGGTVDLTATPPEGVFFSRMSASAHTRGHDRAPAHARAVLGWLEAHGRRVVNGTHVLDLELSKVAQAAALEAAGIPTPRTVAAVGADALLPAARQVPAPFVVKPNRGGTGWGVRRFADHDDLAQAAAAGELAGSYDDILLVQEHVAAPTPHITRVEVVGGKVLYAVRADTSEGYELCPADACRIDGSSLFSLAADADPGLLARYEAFAAAHGIEVGAFEHITAVDGRVLTYDINTNTNYNPEVEAAAEVSGTQAVARFLGGLLATAQRAA